MPYRIFKCLLADGVVFSYHYLNYLSRVCLDDFAFFCFRRFGFINKTWFELGLDLFLSKHDLPVVSVGIDLDACPFLVSRRRVLGDVALEPVHVALGLFRLVALDEEDLELFAAVPVVLDEFNDLGYQFLAKCFVKHPSYVLHRHVAESVFDAESRRHIVRVAGRS